VSFVLYDVETTGLAKRFDQIVHFAALRTDSELRIIDRLQTRCRLMPHIIPSPEAVHVTRLRIEQLTDPALPSHFEMVSAIRRTLQSWCPALFLGFNSLSFDEEFLRHAFYQCLYDAYLTNTQGSASGCPQPLSHDGRVEARRPEARRRFDWARSIQV
jgi:exodeoxyribonuclease-1